MEKRFVSIWFRHLSTDWFSLQQPSLKDKPFVLRSKWHGRMVITSVNAKAQSKNITVGMVLADARAVEPDLEVADDPLDLTAKLLRRLAEWCIRFTPFVAVDLPDGLLFDATGCSHLWGGDAGYVNEIVRRLTQRGYHVRAAMADTVGAAWGIARFGKSKMVVHHQDQLNALIELPPEALRIEEATTIRFHQLGLHQIRQFINMPPGILRRRFGQAFIVQLNRALGQEMELLTPVEVPVPWQERLSCLDPITTAKGIEIALQTLLEQLCSRLKKEEQGLRSAAFTGYRVDGKIEKIEIVTSRPSHHVTHLFRLFELKIQTIEPAAGIELFTIAALRTENYMPQQESMWEETSGLQDVRLAELIDRITTKTGAQSIHRYLPDEHYWPERSVKSALSLSDNPPAAWRTDQRRPVQLLPFPEKIEVTAPIPDYPPMLFRRNGKIHKVARADGPERIEQEWWINEGQHRDYYHVEDEEGNRFWLFRLGHYDDKSFQWFLHGFFA